MATPASMNVIVAAYDSLEAGSSDWVELESGASAGTPLIDAVLIERSDHRVMVVHRWLRQGWGQGAVASAVVGRLSPSALLEGAIAGGVGARVLNFVSNGLSRDAVNELGCVLESGMFVTVAVLERGPGAAPASCGSRAQSLASLPLRGTAVDLRRALRADESDG